MHRGWLLSVKKNCFNNQGITLIELILYAGMLVVILSVFYQFFTLAGSQKISEIVENSLYSNAQHALFEMQNSVEQAIEVTEPILGVPSSTLNLDNGAVVFSISGNQLVKTQGGVTEPITDHYVIIDSLTFSKYGPSTESPTITIDLGLRAKNSVDGRIRTELFQTSVSLR